ncbi:MAG: hypothetical protein HY870_20605 [Chloroflexi bacterium]|nr:hypothetical protein [Chloroflexota bacterium]
MTQLHPIDVVENKTARAVGWLISLPVAVGLFGLTVWLAVSLHWEVRAGVFVITFGAAAVGVFINRVVERQLTARWTIAVRRRVTEPIVTISNAPLRLGDSFQITYQQQILQALEIKYFTLQLIRRTRKVYQRSVSGFQETTERKRERVVQSSKQPGGDFLPETTFHQVLTLTVPSHETPTLQTGNRYEEWLLRVRLVMGRGPAFVGEYPLQVIERNIVR